jgi:putative membrane protein
MTTHDRAFDDGAQNERTSLAWTRTGLALLLAVILASRLTAEALGLAAVFFGAIVAPAALAVLIMAHRRYRTAHRSLHAGRALPDGRLPALAATVTLLLAILEIAYAITA